jgi:outer membrane protein assembly factor BamB
MLMTTFAEWKRRLISPARLHSSRRPGRRHRRRWATATQAVAGFRTAERLEDRTLLSALGAEHILVSSNNAVAEFTDDGAFVQSFSVPFPGGRPGTETVRDVAVGADGRAHVYNGTFEPFVSTLDPLTGTWEHDSHPGWDTVNNVSYGGIATLGDFVFATDMRTFGDTASELGGVVRFDTRDGSSVRSSDVTDFQDLTVGLDGQLYALGEPAFSQVRIYDPQTLTVERSVTLPVSSDYRGIAVNADGDIFAASWNGTVYRFDSNGVLEDSFASGTSNLTDIDVAADGRLIVGGRFGVLIVTDESFADPRVFHVSSRET